MYTTRYNGGYIALMATIIISLVLLVMIVNEGFTGWAARYAVLGTEAKEQANALAEGCADQALAMLITDPTYLGSTTSVTPSGTCSTFAIDPNDFAAGLVTIKTQAVVRDSYANLQLIQNLNSVHLGNIPTAPTYGTLIVQTLVTNPPSPAPQKQSSDFTMVVSGPSGITPTGGTFAGSASGVVVHIPTPVPSTSYAYSTTQNTLSGYAPTFTAPCSGTIKGGEIKSCTVSNAPVTTTLTLIANVNNNDGTGTLQPSDIPLTIDGTAAVLGRAYTVSVGSHTVAATNPNSTTYSASTWGYQCTGAIGSGSVTTNLGDNKICIINLDDNPPPAPICAETVMMLDRSFSMFGNSQWIPDEKTAAKALVDLYASVTSSHPLLGMGRFGDVSTGVSAEIVSTLSSNYSAIKTAIDNALPQNPISFTNLSAAITKANDELNSARHVAGKRKVLILISDGDPNQPTTAVTQPSGFFPPSGNIQNANGDLWSNPSGAYTDGSGDTSDPVSENDRHRFYSFNLPTIASGATVRGIEAKVDAWATTTGTVQTPATVQKAPSALLSGGQWNGAANAYTSNDVYASSSVNNQTQSYGNFGFSIPSGATITGIQISTEAKVSGGSGSAQTPTLYPNNQGFYNAWSGDDRDVNESGTPSCASNDSLIENISNDRESVTVDLSAVPTGATMTSVDIVVYDKADNNPGGTYKTFARLGGTTIDAASNLTAAATGGSSTCNNAKTQTISLGNVVKSGSTALEVGVVKVSGNGNAVRVGAIRAIVTYIPAPTGSIALSLSSNNGANWTSTKSTALDSTESIDLPVGNAANDLWGRAWVPADFADGKFAVRVQNTSSSGITTSLDQVQVTVLYTTALPAPAACDLGVDLSWNGGSNWTSEKTQTLTTTEASYTFGSQTDTWGRTWSPGDFVNGSNKLLARVHAIDPGTNCDAASVNHVDLLQLQVTYDAPTDPQTAALNSADAAKISGTDIFTIYFGSGNPGLLAQLASGPTANGSHQNGSSYDSNSIVNGTVSVFTTAATTTNQFTNASRGFTSDNQYATNAINGNQQGYTGFPFTIPPGATISNVEALVEAKSSDSSGCQVGVSLSSNSGIAYTAMDTANLGGSDSTYTLNGTSALWGRTWVAADFDPAKFVVKLQNIDPGNSCNNNSTLSIDSVQVRVSYTVVQENGDGDNFFISPTSADMKGIFEFIGNQVCPAINNVSSANPPTTASLYVITRVTNNNSGTSASSNFQTTVSGTNVSPASFAGTDTPGKLVTVDPGSYSVTQSSMPAGYTQSLTDSCSSVLAGNIVAGESRVCVITNDDIPPPPAAPNLTITPGTWQEIPDTNP